MKKIFLVGFLSVGILVLLGGIGLNLLTAVSRASSDSMEPNVNAGSLLYTNFFETPEIGDIISFHCKSEYRKLDKCFDGEEDLIIPITHRLTAIDESGCMTIVGDNPKYQSRWDTLPCYKPEEINISGVVHVLTSGDQPAEVSTNQPAIPAPVTILNQNFVQSAPKSVEAPVAQESIPQVFDKDDWEYEQDMDDFRRESAASLKAQEKSNDAFYNSWKEIQ